MTLEVEQKKICKWDFGRSSRGKNGARAIIKEERGGSEVFSLLFPVYYYYYYYYYYYNYYYYYYSRRNPREILLPLTVLMPYSSFFLQVKPFTVTYPPLLLKKKTLTCFGE